MPYKDLIKKRECNRACNKRWREEHKEQIAQGRKEYDKGYKKKYFSKMPWYRHYANARARCKYPTHKTYKYYGGKGIKMLMTLKEVGYIWIRDEAYKMYRPSIDRKDSNGHYSSGNCMFVELSDNCARKAR